jgi:hypothetical protein
MALFALHGDALALFTLDDRAAPIAANLVPRDVVGQLSFA